MTWQLALILPLITDSYPDMAGTALNAICNAASPALTSVLGRLSAGMFWKNNELILANGCCDEDDFGCTYREDRMRMLLLSVLCRACP